MIACFANPARFLRLFRHVVPIGLFLTTIALYEGLCWSFNSPPDYQQGDSVRIMYVHVPSAWLALGVYASMSVAALTSLVWRHTLAELYVRAAAPLGAGFTLICLVTGALWGKPMWGTWWVWDARLTSVLILFFFYIGYMVLCDAFDDRARGSAAGSILVLIGAVNLPIVKFSVDWWNTLHQPASVFRAGGATIDASMLKPLLWMAMAFAGYFICLVFVRLKTEILRLKSEIREAGE